MIDLTKITDFNDLNKVVSDPNSYSSIISQNFNSIANSILVNRIIPELKKQYESLQKRGKLKKEHKKILQSTLIELLKMLEDPNLTEENLFLIQKLIILSLLEETDQKFEFMRKEYIALARSLVPSEMALLGSAMKIYERNNQTKDNLDIDTVYKDIAKMSNLAYPPLVAKYYLSLRDKLVLKSTWDTLNSKVNTMDGKYILTDFGFDFMRYIQQYERIFDEA